MAGEEMNKQTRPRLKGDAPLTPWELEKVRRDAELAARYLREQKETRTC
jgi:hypothetical protein